MGPAIEEPKTYPTTSKAGDHAETRRQALQGMIVSRLGIRNVRNLIAVDLEPVPGLNLIAGVNGAGKTSLLEAIYLLANGHSFRTRRLTDVLTHGSEMLQVTGILAGTDGERIPVGVERSEGINRLRFGGRDVASQAELAKHLPVQAFHPESHRLVSGTPRDRRQYLDWGVFHVEHEFIDTWRRFQRSLRQRNAALKRKSRSIARAFDEELARSGEQIAAARQRYVDGLADDLPGILSRLLPEESVDLRLRRGWPEDRTLLEALEADEMRDLRDGFTHPGPHRCDLDVRMRGHPAAELASRGQQKAIAASLVLSQVQNFGRVSGRRCIMLIDDLPSELDADHRRAVLDFLQEMHTQAFVSAIEPDQLDASCWPEVAVFHVEQGKVRELV